MDRTENFTSNSSSTVSWEFNDVETCLLRHCPAMLGGGAHGQEGDLICLFTFFQNMENRLKFGSGHQVMTNKWM